MCTAKHGAEKLTNEAARDLGAYFRHSVVRATHQHCIFRAHARFVSARQQPDRKATENPQGVIDSQRSRQESAYELWEKILQSSIHEEA